MKRLLWALLFVAGLARGQIPYNSYPPAPPLKGNEGVLINPSGNFLNLTTTGAIAALGGGGGGGNTSPLAYSIFYPTKPITNASIAVAATAANAAGGGIVQLPPSPTVSAGSFVVGSTYIISTVGSTNFTSIGASSNVTGIVFTATGIGSGTGAALQAYSITEPVCGPTGATVCFPSVTYQGVGWGYNFITDVPSGTALACASNSFDGFDYNNTDLFTKPTNSQTFINGMLFGAGISNLTLVGCNYGIKFGALYRPGPVWGTFKNVTVIGANSYSFWFENFLHTNFAHLYSVNGKVGQGWFSSSGATANSGGNSTAEDITFSTYQASASTRGWVMSSRDNPGDNTTNSLNQFSINQMSGSFSARLSPITPQTGTMTSGSNVISVTNSAMFVPDQPVVFSGTLTNTPLLSGVTYHVLTSGSNQLTVSPLIGAITGVANATGSASFTVSSAGFPMVESIGYRGNNIGPALYTNLDLEIQSGGATNSSITLQQTRGVFVIANLMSPGTTATVVTRSIDASTQVVATYLSTPTYDPDVTFSQPYITGTRSTLVPLNSAFSNNIGHGGSIFTGTDSRCQTNSYTIELGGSNYTDECFNKNSSTIDFSNYPLSFGTTNYGASATVGVHSSTNLSYSGSPASTWTLPTIPTNGDGSLRLIRNPSANSLTLSTSQNIFGAGNAPASTFSIPAHSAAIVWSGNDNGIEEWALAGLGGGTGGSGTVSPGLSGQLAVYASAGSAVSGANTVTAAQFPSLSGAITSPGGSLATSFAPISANTLLANTTGGSSAPTAASLVGNLAFIGGALGTTQAINAQTGTTYAILATDLGKLLTFSNGSAVAVSLPQAGTTGFASGFSFDVENLGVGVVTITPATSTINASTTLTIAQNLGCTVTSDGTNYQVSACTAVGAQKGSFTGTLTGMASATTGTVNYVVSGNIAIIYVVSAITGTSDSTSMTMTGIPAQLQPINQTTWSLGQITDNGNSLTGAGSISGGTLTIGVDITNGVTNRVQLAPTGFTSSGTKGLPAGFAMAYPLQ